MAKPGLEPYSGPWERRQARHLVGRTHTGALKRDVDGVLNDGSASAAANRIVDEALADPLPEAPSWYSGSGSTGVSEVYDIQIQWLDALRSRGLIEKMTLLWHNHMPTQWGVNQNKVSNSVAHLTYDYYKLLRLNALGNFETMIRKVGKNAAMHVYLDGYVNEAGAANENYARELLELFTMSQYAPDGSENYSENDIKEVARALTGWVVNGNNVVVFDNGRHDAGVKSFFGRSGSFGYDDVVDTVFMQRGGETADYVARKLYTFFVHAVPDAGVCAALAAQLVSSNYDVGGAARTLLASAHFYDETFIGARVKSPVEYLVGFLSEAEVVVTNGLLDWVRDQLTPSGLGQEVLNPPNVAGWPGLNPPDASGAPGHHTWLTTTTLPERWSVLADIIYERAGASYDPVDLIIKISDPSDPFRVAVDLAENFLSVPLDEVGIRDVSEDFGGDPGIPVPNEILNGPDHVRNLSKILLDGSPFYEWPFITDSSQQGLDDTRRLLRGYLTYLIQLPAYQLV